MELSPLQIQLPSSSISSTNVPSLLLERLAAFRHSKKAILLLVSLAIFTDMAIYGVIIPILPEVAKEGSQSLLFASYAVALLGTTPIFGICSDWLGDRKTPMLIGQIGMLFATLLFCFCERYSWMVIGRILQGISAAATWVVGLAILNDVFGASEMGKVIGFISSVNLAGFIVGPLMGGLVRQWSGSVKGPFVGCALLAGLDLAVRGAIKFPVPERGSINGQRENESDGDGGRRGLNFLDFAGSFASEQAWCMIVVLVVGASTISLLEASLAEHLERQFGMDSMKVSLMFLGLLIPGMLFSLLFGRLSAFGNRKLMMTVGLLLHGVALPFLVFVGNTVVKFVLGLVYFAFTEAMMLTPIIPELAYLAERANTVNYAQIYALYNLCYSAGMMFGPILGSFVGGSGASERHFERASVYFCFGIYCFAPVLLYKYHHHHRGHCHFWEAESVRMMMIEGDEEDEERESSCYETPPNSSSIIFFAT